MCGSDQGSNNAHGVRTSKDVDEEEVELLVSFVCTDEQGNGGTLGGLELSFGVRDGPAVPILEQDGLLLFVLGQRVVVVFSRLLEERVQARILMHLLNNFEWIL